MSRQLPDVNVLLALLWPAHEAHLAAHAWFAQHGRKGWATNTLTQLGVLRLLTNPAVTQGGVSPALALSMVRQLTNHDAHVFWPLDHPITDDLQALLPRIQGHLQWNDAVLLRQAIVRGGVLVSFDKAIHSLSPAEHRKHLQILRAS